MSNKEPSKAEVLRGTLDLMVLQTLAALGPARRGLRNDPTEALRSE